MFLIDAFEFFPQDVFFQFFIHEFRRAHSGEIVVVEGYVDELFSLGCWCLLLGFSVCFLFQDAARTSLSYLYI